MKKLIAGLFVAATFVIYSFHQRGEGSAAVVVAPTLSPTPTPSSGTSSTPSPAAGSGYKDGQYTGSTANAYYGFIRVQATISGGKITDVQFLQYPNDRSTSREINAQAMPYLKQEAIQAQSANVDGVSGATDTSQAFIESLATALKAAQSA